MFTSRRETRGDAELTKKKIFTQSIRRDLLSLVAYRSIDNLLRHIPFHYISEVSTATSTNQHNHHKIDVG